MGINRIRLQNGAMGDPRVDARMQQTYQQNIADNQAQQARNESIFQAARDKLQGFGNTLTGVVEAGSWCGQVEQRHIPPCCGPFGRPFGRTRGIAGVRTRMRRGTEGRRISRDRGGRGS